jgi:hypothetical protein
VQSDNFSRETDFPSFAAMHGHTTKVVYGLPQKNTRSARVALKL